MIDEQLQELIKWLNEQIVESQEAIDHAIRMRDVSRENNSIGKRDAYQNVLQKINKITIDN